MAFASLALVAVLAARMPAEAPPPPVDGAATAPSESAAAPEGFLLEIPFESATLDNGLKVLVHSDVRMPVVCVDVWYHAGAFDEPRGRGGLSRLVERLMFQGSKHSPGDGHLQLLESVGGIDMRGVASFDHSSYQACVPKHEIELVLWLEADRMAWLLDVVDQARLDEQRQALKHAQRQIVEGTRYAAAREALWANILPADHPYRGKLITNEAELDAISLDDVRDFVGRYYAPSNATIAISGDIEVEDARKLTEKYFRSFAKEEKPSKRAVAMPTIGANVRLEKEDRLAALPLISVSFFVPPAFQNGSADIEVLAHLLGDGNASRLHQALVINGQMAHSVSASLISAANVSVLRLEALARPDVNPDDLINGIQAQLDLLMDLPPSEEELARAIASFETRRVLSLQRPLGRAKALQAYAHFAGGPGFLGADLQRYRSVTPETTLAAVNGFLTKERRSVLVVRPAGSTPSEGSAPALAPASEGE